MVTRRGFIGALLGLPLAGLARSEPPQFLSYTWRAVRTPDNLLTLAQALERANKDGRTYCVSFDRGGFTLNWR